MSVIHKIRPILLVLFSIITLVCGGVNSGDSQMIHNGKNVCSNVTRSQ